MKIMKTKKYQPFKMWYHESLDTNMFDTYNDMSKNGNIAIFDTKGEAEKFISECEVENPIVIMEVWV